MVAMLLAQADAAAAGGLRQLGQTPYWVLGGYLLLLLGLGIFGWLRSRSGEEDYYLAGREQGWLVSSLTIMATFFSSFALLGAPGMVYREGVIFALFSLNVPVGGLCVYFLGIRIWKAGRKYGYVTPGDMVADYYSSKWTLRLLVAVTGFLYAIPYVVMQIQAGGLVSKELFGAGFFEEGAIVLALITMVYIMIGGMRSVAWTDLIQGLFLITGMLVSGFAMLLVFGGVGEFSQRVTAEVPDSSLTAPGNTGAFQWTLTFSICILASSGSMVQPAQWMRFYSARSAATLKRAAVIFALVLTSCFILGVMLIGLAGQVLYPLHIGQSVKVELKELSSGSEQFPAEIRDNFRFIPGNKSANESTLIWSWPMSKDGKATQPPKLGPEQMSALSRLSSDAKFQTQIQALKKKVDANKKPDLMPNPLVDYDPTRGKDYDGIIVTVLTQQLPRVLKDFGTLFACLILVAIMAASMSTADSNLHALSAVLTRDIYDQFVRPKASENERVWVGRGVIVAATILSLVIVMGGRSEISSKFDFLNMIAKMGLMAIAFSAQLLPITIDMLFIRRGTGIGAAVGLAAGLTAAFLFGPLFGIVNEILGQPEYFKGVLSFVAETKGLLTVRDTTYGVHGSVWGLLFNVPLFVIVSMMTPQVPKENKQKFADVMD